MSEAAQATQPNAVTKLPLCASSPCQDLVGPQQRHARPRSGGDSRRACHTHCLDRRQPLRGCTIANLATSI